VHKFCGRLFLGLCFLFELWFGVFLVVVDWKTFFPCWLLSAEGWNFSHPVCVV
jgi:hypothetical protein